MSQASTHGPEAILATDLPEPVADLVALLRKNGHAAVLVGGCVRDLLRHAPVHDFDLATSAAPERVLELLPRAVPIGLHHGTVMVPTRCGPIDVTTFRGGGSLRDDLALRDLTVNAMALDPETWTLQDPFGGRDDLAAGRLRAVGDPQARLAEDPLRAVRVARLTAQLGFAVDPLLEDACTAIVPALESVARERIGHEVRALLTAPHPERGLAFLRRTGLEAKLAPGVHEDAARLVARVPADPLLRFGAWLRGTNAERVLMRLRLSHTLAVRVARLLSIHPVEEAAPPDRPAAVRRLLRRVGEEDLLRLVALRRAELAVTPEAPGADLARARLEELEATLERIHSDGALALSRRDLALDGAAVMAHLGCGPGRSVGRALDHLTECVLEDPSCNTAEGLRSLLDAWHAAQTSGT